MNVAVLILETPRAGTSGHRVLVPEGFEGSFAVVEPLLAAAHGNLRGVNYLAAARQVAHRSSNGTVRVGPETIVLAGIDVERLSAMEISAIECELAMILAEDVPLLMERHDIDWDQEGRRRILVPRPELRQWTARFPHAATDALPLEPGPHTMQITRKQPKGSSRLGCFLVLLLVLGASAFFALAPAREDLADWIRGIWNSRSLPGPSGKPGPPKKSPDFPKPNADRALFDKGLARLLRDCRAAGHEIKEDALAEELLRSGGVRKDAPATEADKGSTNIERARNDGVIRDEIIRLGKGQEPDLFALCGDDGKKSWDVDKDREKLSVADAIVLRRWLCRVQTKMAVLQAAAKRIAGHSFEGEYARTLAQLGTRLPDTGGVEADAVNSPYFSHDDARTLQHLAQISERQFRLPNAELFGEQSPQAYVDAITRNRERILDAVKKEHKESEKKFHNDFDALNDFKSAYDRLSEWVNLLSEDPPPLRPRPR